MLAHRHSSVMNFRERSRIHKIECATCWVSQQQLCKDAILVLQHERIGLRAASGALRHRQPSSRLACVSNTLDGVTPRLLGLSDACRECVPFSDNRFTRKDAARTRSAGWNDARGQACRATASSMERTRRKLKACIGRAGWADNREDGVT